MFYAVQPGDSLWSIAHRFYGVGARYGDIARANHLQNPNRLLVGQVLWIAGAYDTVAPTRNFVGTNQGVGGRPQVSGPLTFSAEGGNSSQPALIPGRAYVFVLADEVNLFSRKVVRRVIVSEKMAAEAARHAGKPIPVFPNPERFGFMPSDPSANVSLGRHVINYKPSRYISASDKTFGARRFAGEPFWIDIEKAKVNGATVHELDEIVADLSSMANSARNSDRLEKIASALRNANRDKEVVFAGGVVAKSVKGATAMGLTRLAHGVQIIGFAMTAYDLKQAGEKSLDQHSVKPLAAEGIRQAGGWAAAWAGVKIGAATGAAFGIETGPGAVVTAVVGGAVGGTLGYFGFDWIADHIDAN